MATLSLLAKLSLDKTGFDSGLASANKLVTKFGTDMQKQIGRAFGAAAFIAFARGVVETGKEIDELAAKLRVTGEEAQKIRLKEKLGGDVGRGNLLMSDEDLETLRVADRLFIKLRATAEAAFIKFQRLPFFGGGVVGLVENIAKLTGFVSGKPPEGPPGPVQGPPSDPFLKRQELIKRLSDEADAIQDKTRFNALTKEKQINELIKERQRLLKRIASDEFAQGKDPEGRARVGLRFAQIGAELQDLQRKDKPNLGDNVRVSGGAPGIFVGGLRGGVGGGVARTDQLLTQIQRTLAVRGIVVRRTQ